MSLAEVSSAFVMTLAVGGHGPLTSCGMRVILRADNGSGVM